MVGVIQKSFQHANYAKFMHCNKTLENYNFYENYGISPHNRIKLIHTRIYKSKKIIFRTETMIIDIY